MPNPAILPKQPFVDEHNILTREAQKFLWALAPQKPVMAPVSVSASPFTYANGDHFTGLTVSGGTVSAIELSTDGQVWANCGVSAGMFQLQPYDQLRVTYSGLPTLTACYRVSVV